ncbi:hypothetical protein BMF81_01337 [Nodularia spumigena UHCC 0039]|uniref:Uncharacterized protein n=1 Tax=Nodularia spumigena UHCC 0039 TaxID=1914872 RepID=A0A2S0Q6R7_NODSP|nr:hypothetical protein BMF81_01337 [Nodularia spumigena UHCC 0039]
MNTFVYQGFVNPSVVIIFKIGITVLFSCREEEYLQTFLSKERDFELYFVRLTYI